MSSRVLVLTAMLASSAFAQSPRTISFQGVLADAGGNLIPDGNHQLRLTLYTGSAGGSGIYTELQTVPVVKRSAYFLGVFVDGGAEHFK